MGAPMRFANRRTLAAAAMTVAVAGVAGAAVALDRPSAPADPDAVLTELRDVQERPVVDGTLARVAAEAPSRGGLGMWAYRSAEGRDEVMITRDGRAVFITGCAAGEGPLGLCGLRMRAGEGVVVVGRAAPGVEVVTVSSAIATRAVAPENGHWIALLPGSDADPASALPVRVEARADGVLVGTADPGLPR